MPDDALLFSAFDDTGLAVPDRSQTWLAAGLKQAPLVWRGWLSIEQPFRPFYLDLQKNGFNVVPRWNNKTPADGALLQLGRHKKRNEADFARLLQRVCPGGMIIVTGEKTTGIDSFLKKTAKFISIQKQLSRKHGRIFTLKRPDNITGAICALLPDPEIIQGFETRAGMFSHGKIDIGSALLVRHLQGRLKNMVADFGAGWGFLSKAAIEAGASTVDLYEADFDALQAARKNLGSINAALNFHWCDLKTEIPQKKFDCIIMNPPFHETRAAEPQLGQIFIRRAAESLKKGGNLLMVANRHLPYETTLRALFSSLTILEQADGFKILEAR